MDGKPTFTITIDNGKPATALLIVLLACGCVPPVKKAVPIATQVTPTASDTDTPQLHRQPAVHSHRTVTPKLRDAEKDKLYQNFKRWFIANEGDQLGASPVSPKTDGAVARPAN
jgi:hypothetical protein